MTTRAEPRTGGRRRTTTAPGRRTAATGATPAKRAPAKRETRARREAAGVRATPAEDRRPPAWADSILTGRPALRPVVAAQEAIRRYTVTIPAPFVGVLRLPPKEDLVFLGGIAGLALLGLVEWPVAIILGVGHTLAVSRHSSLLTSFGEALEAA
jgi:hypothetical protein